MKFDRVLRNVETPRDLLVTQAVGEHLQDLGLARGESQHWRSRRIAGVNSRQSWQVFDDSGMKYRQTLRRRLGRCHNLLACCPARQNGANERVRRAERS